MSSHSLSPDQLAKQTYQWERIRSLFTGFIELIWQPGSSVALLIAIRYYDAGTLAKGLISSSAFIGFLCTPLTLSLFAHSRMPIHRPMSGLYVMTGCLLAGIPLTDGLWTFAILISLANVVMVQYVPMYTEMYSSHYTTAQRGHRISTIFMISGAVGIGSNLLVGRLLDYNLGLFRLILLMGSACCFVSAGCLSRVPSRPLAPEKVGNPLKNIRLAWTDKLFGWILLSWMMLGFGNLMTLPLRIDYMANPRFGINADNQTIFLITGAIPLSFRLIASRHLGKLFDRWNLATLRITLNSLFLCSILLFFNTRNLYLLGFSMALLGTAMAGGRIAWSLWVTKLAPPGLSAAYMSVHMLSTGIRGTVAPFVGFALMDSFSPMQVSGIGIALVLTSTLMFIPARKHMQKRTEEMESKGFG